MERDFINIEIPSDRESLFAELKEKFNPEGSKLRTYQLSLLNILIEFDKYARENNITYSLAYGTALGAIRHKGFIPWDDDIDIMMTRSEWNHFETIIKNNPQLTNKLSVRFRLKPEIIMEKVGIMDLFILDVPPNGKFKRYFKRMRISLLQWLYRCRIYFEAWRAGLKPHLKPWQILMPIALMRKTNSWEKSWNRAINSMKNTNSVEYCDYTAAVRDIHRIFPQSAFNGHVEVEFEGHKFPIIKGYDEFLTCAYGNYMNMPQSKHNHDRVN